MKKVFRPTRALFALISLLALLLTTPAATDASTSVAFPSECEVGKPFVVALSSHEPFDSPTVKWLGRTVSLDVEPGREGFVSYGLLGSFVRDVKPGEYPLEFEFSRGERLRVTCQVVLKPGQYEEEQLTVEPKMVTPAKKDIPRIQKETALSYAARNTMTVRRRWTSPPARPVEGVFTGAYGSHRIFNGVPKGYHNGVDFRAPVGTPILAPFAGTVVLVGDHYYSGKSVYIDSGNGVISMLFHMSEIGVKQGQRVEKGQVVGKSGATGRVTGPHLHYSLSLAGQYVDSAPLFGTSITAMLGQAPTRHEVVLP